MKEVEVREQAAYEFAGKQQKEGAASTPCTGN